MKAFLAAALAAALGACASLPPPAPPGPRGKVVLLDFWASWCDPCRDSIPFYAAAAARLGPRGFAVVGVNEDDDHDAARAFAAKAGLSGPPESDEGRRLYRAYGVRLLPTAVLLDREGKVRGRWDGFSPESGAAAVAAAEALLSPAPPK